MTQERTIPARRFRAAFLSLALAGCGDDTVEAAPVCDDIGHPLGVTPTISPPAPEYDVECAHGWGNAVVTRPAIDTDALPDRPAAWMPHPHPMGGWVMAIMPGFDQGWLPWLAVRGVKIDFSVVQQNVQVLLWIRQDGSLGWAIPEVDVSMIDFVGDEIWALGWHPDFNTDLFVLNPASGEVLASRNWDQGPGYNMIAAASDPAGGAWITGIKHRETDDLVDQTLYRAIAIDSVEIIATRTTERPKTIPSGGVVALQDGAAAWWTGDGFDVVEADGSIRWTHSAGLWQYPWDFAFAHDANSMLVTSLVPTEFGPGSALRLEKVAIADGSVLWTREHQRFEVVDPEACGPNGCELADIAHSVLRPDGGYLLIGQHAYPSSTCVGQPLIMAVSADGDAEWAHRVETCGSASRAAFRDASKLEILGITWADDESTLTGAWTRWFEL
jgi:hypothetical protein